MWSHKKKLLHVSYKILTLTCSFLTRFYLILYPIAWNCTTNIAILLTQRNKDLVHSWNFWFHFPSVAKILEIFWNSIHRKRYNVDMDIFLSTSQTLSRAKFFHFLFKETLKKICIYKFKDYKIGSDFFLISFSFL